MLRLPVRFAEEIIDDARTRAPAEACGLVAASADIGIKLYKIANVDPSPFRYEMDPRSLYEVMCEIEDNGWDLGAIYHSHPHTEAYPSPTDRELAFYPDVHYLIVSLQQTSSPVLRAFKIHDGMVDEQAITLI